MMVITGFTVPVAVTVRETVPRLNVAVTYLGGAAGRMNHQADAALDTSSSTTTVRMRRCRRIHDGRGSFTGTPFSSRLRSVLNHLTYRRKICPAQAGILCSAPPDCNCAGWLGAPPYVQVAPGPHPGPELVPPGKTRSLPPDAGIPRAGRMRWNPVLSDCAFTRLTRRSCLSGTTSSEGHREPARQDPSCAASRAFPDGSPAHVAPDPPPRDRPTTRVPAPDAGAVPAHLVNPRYATPKKRCIKPLDPRGASRPTETPDAGSPAGAHREFRNPPCRPNTLHHPVAN